MDAWDDLIQQTHDQVDAEREDRGLQPYKWSNQKRSVVMSDVAAKMALSPEEKEEKDDNTPLSALVAQRGIRTSADFADFMGGLMADLVEGRITPKVATAACEAGNALLKVAMLQLEYGINDKGEKSVLQLSGVAKK